MNITSPSSDEESEPYHISLNDKRLNKKVITVNRCQEKPKLLCAYNPGASPVIWNPNIRIPTSPNYYVQASRGNRVQSAHLSLVSIQDKYKITPGLTFGFLTAGIQFASKQANYLNQYVFASASGLPTPQNITGRVGSLSGSSTDLVLKNLLLNSDRSCNFKAANLFDGLNTQSLYLRGYELMVRKIEKAFKVRYV